MSKEDTNKDRFTSPNVVILPNTKEKHSENKNKKENELLRKVFKGEKK